MKSSMICTLADAVMWRIKSMKKNLISFLLIVLAAAMLFSMAACGSTAFAEVPEATPEAAPAEPEPSANIIEAEEPAEAPENEASEEAGSVPEYKTAARYDTAWIEELRNTLPPLPDIDINSWEFVVANYYNCLNQFGPENYGGYEGQGVDSRIVEAATNFINAARNEGYHMYMAAGYRNFEYNKNHYISYCHEFGSADEAAKYFLPPGCTEHQTGLAIDLTDDYEHSAFFAEFGNEEFLETDAYKWALEHCAEYGFINRYPEGKEEFYGYPCHCAGHFRYVGVEAAKYITENNLCLEEFVALYDPSLVFIPSKITE